MPNERNLGDFREGDTIVMLSNCSGVEGGEVLTVMGDGGELKVYHNDIPNSNDYCTCQEPWELVEHKNKKTKVKYNFAVGDKVFVKDSRHSTMAFSVGDYGIITERFGGMSKCSCPKRKQRWALNQYATDGSLKNTGYYACENSLELVEPKKNKTKKVEIEKIDELIGGVKKKPEKKNIDLEIFRKDGETFFKFSIDKRLEDLYAKLSEKIVNSEKWEGLQFYFIPNMTKSEAYKEKLNTYRLFDDFGQDLMVSGRLNIAWLRTIGGNGTIKITDNFTIAEMVQAAQRAQGFVKEHFEDSFRDFRIKATISIEV